MNPLDHSRSATDAASAIGKATTARVALVLGAHDALGQQMLALLVDDARYAWVHVGLRHSLGAATPRYRPWVIGHSTIVADDAFVFVGDPHEPATPSPVARFRTDDLQRAAGIARDAGVRRLLVVSASAPPLADPSRFAADEAALTTLGFETVVLARAVANDNVIDRGGWKRRTGMLGRAVSVIMRPSTLRSTQPATAAAALLDHFSRCGPGVHAVGARAIAGVVPT